MLRVYEMPKFVHLSLPQVAEERCYSRTVSVERKVVERNLGFVAIVREHTAFSRGAAREPVAARAGLNIFPNERARFISKLSVCGDFTFVHVLDGRHKILDAKIFRALERKVSSRSR